MDINPFGDDDPSSMSSLSENASSEPEPFEYADESPPLALLLEGHSPELPSLHVNPVQLEDVPREHIAGKYYQICQLF